MRDNGGTFVLLGLASLNICRKLSSRAVCANRWQSAIFRGNSSVFNGRPAIFEAVIRARTSGKSEVIIGQKCSICGGTLRSSCTVSGIPKTSVLCAVLRYRSIRWKIAFTNRLNCRITTLRIQATHYAVDVIFDCKFR